MRDIDAIRSSINAAATVGDIALLDALSKELEADSEPVARIWSSIAQGLALRLSGRYPEALAAYSHVRDLYEELGDKANAASTRRNIGLLLATMGDLAGAMVQYQRALSDFEGCMDRVGLAQVVALMGGVYLTTGDFGQALTCYQRALDEFQTLGMRLDVANCMGGIGNVYAATDDLERALQYYEQTLEVYTAVNDQSAIARSLSNIGIVHRRSNDLESALEYYQRALEIFEASSDQHGVMRVKGNIVYALLQQGRIDEAERVLLEQSRVPMPSASMHASFHSNRAGLAALKQDLAHAQDHLQQALRIAEQTGMRPEAAEYHMRLRDLALKRDDFKGYVQHNDAYLRISEEIRGKQATQRMAMLDAERVMESERRERDRERALLFGTLPRSVADRMLRGESVTGDHFEHAAILFIDVVDFTSHTADMHPAEVVALLDGMFNAFDAICAAHDVIKIKTIGDSYMCFRGDADASTNALSVARVALDAMHTAFTWPNGETICFRAGIHIGPATAGVIGSQRLQYDVWGDTVNVASRMESTGEAGRIHVSEAFANLLSADPQTVGALTLTPRGQVNIKGKGAMQTSWLELR